MLKIGRIVFVVSMGLFSLIPLIGFVAGAQSFQGSFSVVSETTAVTLTETRQLMPTEPVTGTDFGVSVVLSGSIAVVGAPGQAIVGSEPGAVYIFEQDADGMGQWGETLTMTAHDGTNGDSFGVSLAYDGNILAVGAPFAVVDGKMAQGAVYLFTRNGSGAAGWAFTRKITVTQGNAGDTFGFADLDNGRLLVGAFGAAVGGNARQGAAYLFERDAGGADNWGQTAVLTVSDGVANDYFGGTVALLGDTAVIDEYVFGRQADGSWLEMAKLAPADGAGGVLFGNSVALNGDVIAIGAPSANVNGHASQGAVYVYGRDQNGIDQWGQISKITVTDGIGNDAFGISIALMGETLVVGAPGADKTYLFRQNAVDNAVWEMTAVLTGSDIVAGNEFGLGTTIDRGGVLVGGRTANSAYLFDLRNYLYLPLVRR